MQRHCVIFAWQRGHQNDLLLGLAHKRFICTDIFIYEKLKRKKLILLKATLQLTQPNLTCPNPSQCRRKNTQHIILYGIHEIWDDLKKKDLAVWEKK